MLVTKFYWYYRIIIYYSPMLSYIICFIMSGITSEYIIFVSSFLKFELGTTK